MVQDIKDVVTWLQNWFSVTSDVVLKSQGSGNASKNVVTDSSGDVTLENKVSCGTGLSFDGSVGNKINHSNSITAQTSTVFKKFKYDAQGHITGTGNVQSSDLPSHTHNSTQITDSNTYSYFTPSDDTQSEINKAIDSAIGSLSSINAIEVVTTKPTASASTMGKLYIVSENSKVNVYYTERSGSSPNYSYSWHKMDTDILDELSIDWSDVQNKPTKTSDFTNDGSDGTSTYVEADELSTVATTGDYDDLIDKPSIPTDVSDLTDTDNTAFTPKSHTHGQVTNDGKITSTAVTVASGDNIVITDASDSSKIKRVANLLASHIQDGTAHSNIGSSANDTQATINTSIDTALSNKQGKIYYSNSQTEPLASDYNVGDLIVWTVEGIATNGTMLMYVVSIGNNNTKAFISFPNTVAGGLQYASKSHTHSNYVTSIALMPKGSDPTSDNYNGVIRLYYGDEPS